MTQVARSGPPSRASSLLRPAVLVTIAVVVSLLLGLFVLPRIHPAAGRRGILASDFSLPIVAGGEPGDRISLEALRGKVVVLDFWATWCGPCAEQTRILEGFAAGMPPGVQIVGVNEGESVPVLRAYFEQRQAAYPIVSDPDELVGQSFGVRGLPTLAVIDKVGRITSISNGVVSYARLTRLVAAASSGP